MGEVAVLGVGAVGTAVAVALTQAGHAPRLCLRRARSQVELSCGDDAWTLPLEALRNAWLEPEAASPVQTLFVATKAHQTAGAAPWLGALTGPTTRVVVLQNGIEHRERLRPLVHEGATIVPAVVDLPAHRPSPDRVVLRRPGTVALASAGVEELFEGAPSFVQVFVHDDWPRAAWRKLCVNVISGAIPTLTDRPAGVFRDPAVQRLARGLVEEARVVAAAEGVSLPASLADEIVAGFAESPPQALNSMLLDRRAGRLLEADARNGAVARIGARHGIPTPLNAMAATLLNALGRAER